MSSNASTPNRSTQSSSSKSKTTNAKPSRSGGQSSTPLFTPRMQDRQARNKDPYDLDTSSDDSDPCFGGERWDAYGNDSYENVQLRRGAAEILDNPELLMMHAAARFDSIPGTRNHFIKILCGYYDSETDKDKALQLERGLMAEEEKSMASKNRY